MFQMYPHDQCLADLVSTRGAAFLELFLEIGFTSKQTPKQHLHLKSGEWVHSGQAIRKF